VVRLCLQLMLVCSCPFRWSFLLQCTYGRLNVLEQFVFKEKDSVQLSNTSGIESAGTVINAISPHNFGIVVGFLEGFIQIRDAIGEVSFYLALNSCHQTKILKGPPICKACLDGADCCAKGFSCPPKAA
jgi:hypothetical protein